MLCVLKPSSGKAQDTWQTAQLINHNTFTSAITYSNEEYWFSFVAQTEEVGIVAEPSTAASNANISNIGIYSLNAGSMTTITESVGDTFCSVSYNNLVIGSQYYIKLTNLNTSEPWVLNIKDNVIIVYEDYSCPPACANLVFNGDFESTDNLAITNNNPFNITLANMLLYEKLVCTWYSPTGSPQISQTNNNTNNVAYMWSQYLYLQPEAIATKVELKANTEYTIEFDYKYAPTSIQNTATIKFLPYSTIDENNWNNSGLVMPSPTYTTSMDQYSYTFTASQDYNSLVIYPDIPNVGGRNHFYIDNIEVKPAFADETPIIDGPFTICNKTSSINYSILNFDPVHYIYRYQVNNGPIYATINNTFSIDINEFNQKVNSIRIWNSCDGETIFKVYECCEPLGYTLFADEDLTNAKINTVTNNKIVINGVVTVTENISLNNFDIKFGPMAKIIVQDGYNFTINGGTLEDECDELWDGIYIENTDNSNSSKLTLNNVSLIKGAKNAVVSMNNGEIEIIGCTFRDNIKGIIIKDYDPNTCDPMNPPSVVPTYDANIHSNVFERVSLPYLSDYVTGIQIDSAYKVTIGNTGSLSYQNLFKNLDIGISVNTSSVYVYNNKFEDINNGSNPPDLTIISNKPNNKIAIKAVKPILQPNTSLSYNQPPQIVTSCLGSTISVGSSVANGGNEFDNCDFGIYSYKHSVSAVNNNFTNQIYNSIWVWDAPSSINDNTIYQKSGTQWQSNENLNAAIFVEKTLKVSSSYAFQIANIKNNSITNARNGIALVNCGAHPNNPNLKSVIELNEIEFIDFNTSSSDVDNYKYTGIWAANSKGILIKRNSIDKSSSHTIYSYQNLIGIRVDKTSDAWVSHNYDFDNLGTAIWIVGDCHNTQFSCNQIKSDLKGIYTYNPTNTGINSKPIGTIISHQGSTALNRPQDNFFFDLIIDDVSHRIDGGLNTNNPYTYGRAIWHYRTGNNGYNPELSSTHSAHEQFLMQNPETSCTGGIMPPPDPTDDNYAQYRDELYGYIVRNEIDYIEYEDEFEYFEDEYLFEILYSDPDIMNIGEPEDTSYINFYNYISNSNIQEYIDIQDLIDEENFADALMHNGAIVVQNLIESNKQYVNDVYLNSFAQGKYYDENQAQTLLAIARLSPYIGGDAVYSARVMLGFNPNNENLPYIAHPNDSSEIVLENTKNNFNIYPNPTTNNFFIESDKVLEKNTKFVVYDISAREIMSIDLIKGENKFNINTESLKAGVYFYQIGDKAEDKSKIIILE